ncbi:MAG TPA: GNAT family N-acetyltransferase [Acidimicrobiia bacterium]|nr:GNAT family N-acetyltransferase [Acidimicrobiia bacterium]
MKITARRAGQEDIPALLDLYRGLEEEMTALHSMWPLADGLAEPVETSFRALLGDPDNVVIVGELDGYPFGFVWARVEQILPQAGGVEVGSIRLIYVAPGAREVSLGEEMRDYTMDLLRERGISRFDAHVLPGHRLAKNFFEAGGFSARSIIMHHDDARDR